MLTFLLHSILEFNDFEVSSTSMDISFLQERIGELEQTVAWLKNKVEELETGKNLQVSVSKVPQKLHTKTWMNVFKGMKGKCDLTPALIYHIRLWQFISEHTRGNSFQSFYLILCWIHLILMNSPRTGQAWIKVIESFLVSLACSSLFSVKIGSGSPTGSLMVMRHNWWSIVVDSSLKSVLI